MTLVYALFPQCPAFPIPIGDFYFDDTEASAEIAGTNRLAAAIWAAHHGNVRSLIVTARASFCSHSSLPPIEKHNSPTPRANPGSGNRSLTFGRLETTSVTASSMARLRKRRAAQT